MFTVGIFTTHTPYIAMVALYAYFLIFGVNQASDGKIDLAEKPITVEVHMNKLTASSVSDTHCFYSSFTENITGKLFKEIWVKQKWKHFVFHKINPQDHSEFSLFGRPPPTFT